MRRMRNGPGRNQCLGGRVENSKGFYPDSFDRVLLDAPCSALGLRPRLFVGEVGEFKLQLICPFVFYNIFLFQYFETTGEKKRTPEIDFITLMRGFPHWFTTCLVVSSINLLRLAVM